ncbi:hypothetical protein ILP97_40100 [Amycolatopsis sp. H6(2020)]|nr:hypothetical protein [Amycolatopsis sp. H6(2020)]
MRVTPKIRRAPVVAAGVLLGTALVAGFGPGVAGAGQQAMNGCERAGTVSGYANYRCEIYTSGGAPTQFPLTLEVVGHMPQGTNGFFCQYQDPYRPVYLPNGAKNNWWAQPSNPAFAGWLNVVYLSGGKNYSPEPGLPPC